MAKLINRNKKIALIGICAIVLFVLVNYCMWDNANASSSNDGTVRKGKLIEEGSSTEGTTWRYYRFTEEDGNLGHFVLNADNCTFKKDCSTWQGMYWNTDDSLIWEKEINGINPVYDDYLFPNKNWRMMDIRFMVSKNVTHCIGAIPTDTFHNCISVGYKTDTPWDSGDNHFRFHFAIDVKPNKTKVTKTFNIWDKFSDGYDNSMQEDNNYNKFHFDGDTLERAGHDDGYGDNINLAWEEASKNSEGKIYNNIVDPILDGRIEIRLTEIRMWD